MAEKHIAEAPLHTNSGETIFLPMELVDALGRFMAGKKPAGEVSITFRNGGVAGIECRERLK